jgi:hypothetical protein
VKSAAEIQAERLRSALTEACCDDCGTMTKKTGKKVCCGDKPKASVDRSPGAEFEGGQDVQVRVTEEKKRPTTHPFIKRCVAAITKSDENVERAELSRAFAICTAQMKKSPDAARAKKKEGVPADRMTDYESALKQARKKEEADVTLFNRVNARTLAEKEGKPTKPEAELDGQPGYWRRVAGSNIFFAMDGTPQMPIGVERAKDDGKKAEKPAAKKDDKKESKFSPEVQKNLKEMGKALSDKKQGEMNIGKESLADVVKYAQEQFKKAGTTAEAVLGPDFEKNMAALKEKMSHADDIPRIKMPVIEPPTKDEKKEGGKGDIGKFKDAMNKGDVDVRAPFAKETKKIRRQYGTAFPWEHGDVPMPPGSPEAKKLAGLGKPSKDGGPKSDDVTHAKEGHSQVTDLKPLQNQIWMNKVIGNLMQFGVPEQGGHLTDESPIIVSKDGFILDGHHRFGQAMLANPKLKLKSVNVDVDKPQLLRITRMFGTALGNKTKA